MTDPSDRHASTRIDDAVAFRIHRTNRMLLTQLARMLGEHEPGITPEKWFLLARLHQDGPVRQVQLTEPALGDAPNVSRLVESLVGSGMIERQPDPDDRRSKVLHLSAQGAALATRLIEASIPVRHAVFEGFSESELDVLTSALDRIDQNLRRSLSS